MENTKIIKYCRFLYSNQYAPFPVLNNNYGNVENRATYSTSNSFSPFHSLTDGATYIQERMSSLFLETGYENIYLAIGIAATGLFVIETLVRVYRIYEANNKKRKRRKRNQRFGPEEVENQLDNIIIAIVDSYNKFQL